MEVMSYSEGMCSMQVLRSIGNLVAGDARVASTVLVTGQKITG